MGTQCPELVQGGLEVRALCGTPRNPQSWNRFAYVHNNPVNLVDPEGNAAETVVDAGFVAYDLGDIIVTAVAGEQVTWSQIGNLGLSVLGASVPFLPAAVLRGASKADDVVEGAVRVGDEVVEASHTGLRAEKALLGSKKHGVHWTEGSARAKKTGKPQGQFQSELDVDFAVSRAENLQPGTHGVFDLPRGHSSVVHRPDGSTVPASKVWVRRNSSGTVHAYPLE